MPAIRPQWADIELQEHKDLQHEQMFSLVVFMLLIKIHMPCGDFCKKALWQAYIDHINMANEVPIFIGKA